LRNGQVLAAGGFNSYNNYLDSAEVYDPAAKTWKGTGSLKTARAFHTATLLGNGKVLAVGGGVDSESSMDSAELYTPRPAFSPLAPLLLQDQ
jgi:N-acetylneuraminic acid mutarotase